MVKIIDRTKEALGGQKWGRSESDIDGAAWHYTAVDRLKRGFITGHENFWKNVYGWTFGGYHYYIDADGNIYQNYLLTTITNGVYGHNRRLVHIAVEANSSGNYSQAQVDARQKLTLMLMERLGLSASAVNQHKEHSGNNTSCAGYTKAQMNKFRKELAKGKGSNVQVAKPKPAKPQPKPAPSTSKWTPVIGHWSGETLRQGHYGDPVKQLQRLLASYHFYPDVTAKNNGIDSYYGAKTKDAVERYQMMHGLAVDGIAGKATFAKLRNPTKPKSSKPKPKQAWAGQTLRRGSRGAKVTQLQEMLSAKYYYPDKGARNNGINGHYGAKTVDAVRRYQMMHKLTVDGIAGRATYNSLRK